MTILAAGRLWIGIAISALCLWLALREVPFGSLAQSVAGAQYAWLLPAIALLLLSILARAQRWVVLLHKTPRLADAFWSQGVGYLFTNVFPLRAGEPARVIVMSGRSGLPLMQVAASAFIERLLDVAVNVAVLLLVLPWMRVPALVVRSGIAFGALTLVALVVLVLVARFTEQAETVLRILLTRSRLLPVEPIVKRWRQMVSGLVPLTCWGTSLRAIGWSLATWSLTIAGYWLILRSFRTDSALVEAAFMVVALAFAVSVPSSPGFVGIFQLVGQQALALPFGTKYDVSTALAIVLTAHVTYFLLTSALGVVGLWKLGQSFALLGRRISMVRNKLDATPPEASL